MQLQYVLLLIHIVLTLNHSQEYMKSAQSALEATLVKVIITPEPFPLPGRALRNLAARCFVALYTQGETRTLFDTLQAFMKVVGDLKTPDKDTNKMYVLSLAHNRDRAHFLSKSCFLLRWRTYGRVWCSGMWGNCLDRFPLMLSDQFMSFMAEITTVTLKTYKSSSVSSH
jgi:HEAT repeat-containing protein 5